MKIVKMVALGIVALLGVLGCSVFSGVAENPAPTRIVIVEPTVTPLPLPTTMPTPAPNAQVFTVTESDLNQQLGQNLPSDGQVSNVFLDLHPGNVANVSATLRLNSLTLQPNAAIKVNVANNRISIDVTQVSVSGLGVPGSMIQPQIDNLKALAENQLNRQLETLEQNTGFKLQSVNTTEDSLTLYFAP